MNSPSRRAIGAIVILTFALQSVASAHAFLDRAEPRVGSTTRRAPSEVRIWFTQRLEPVFSKIQVFDAQGNEIDKRDTHVDSKEKTLLVVSLPELASGTYKVAWRVVSVDTHRTQGNFKFTVEPGH